MLIFENVFYSYKKGKYVLNNISIKFPEYGFILIKGKSGSGKTTLINLISGLDVPTKGKIVFENEILSADRLDSFRKKEASIVFQDFNLIRNLSIRENLRIAFEASGFSYDENEAKKYFEILNLSFEDIIDRFPTELSGGQQQRIAIIRSLIKKPRILVLDEPTSSLDYSNAEDVLLILKKLSEKILVVVASHDLLRLEKLATNVISLDNEDEKGTNGLIIPIDGTNKKYARNKKNLSFHSIISFVISLRFKNRFRIIGTLIANTLLLLLITFSSCLVFNDANESLLSGQKSMHSPYFLATLQEKKGISYQLVCFDKKTEDRMMAKGYARLSYIGQIMTSFYDDDVPYTDYSVRFFTSFRRNNYAVELTDNLSFDFDERIDKNKQHYPLDYNEIMITSSIADFLVEYSFQDSIDKNGNINKSKKYQSVSDLFENGYCYDKKITAIVETPDKNYLDFLNKSDSNSQKKWEGFTIAKSVFVKSGYNDWLQTQSNDYVDFSTHDRPLYMLGKVKNRNDVFATLNEIRSFSYKNNHAEYEIKVNNLYNNHIYFSYEFKIDRYPGIILIVFVLALSIISSLITASLFSSIAKKEDVSLGIMHSLGASRKDINLIVCSAAVLLFTIEFLLFALGYTIFWLVINSIISTELLFFSFISLPLIIVLLSSILIMSLSILPSLKSFNTIKPLARIREFYK